MSGPFRILVGLSVLFILGALLSWYSVDPLKYIVIDVLHDGAPIKVALQQAISSLRAFDFGLLLSALILFLSLLVVELRLGAVSAALRNPSPGGFRLLVVSMLIWLCHAYLVPGDLIGGDASSHVGRIAHASMALRGGEFISWDNYYYAGSTFLQYTGPLYFWVCAVFDLMLQDPNLTSKVVLFAGSLSSGILFYWCLSEHRVSRYGSTVGALVYAGSYAHLHQLLWDGNHPQVLTMVLAPLSLIFLHRCLRRTEVSALSWSILTLVNIALLVNHQSMAKQFGLIFIVYTLTCLAFNRKTWRRVPVLFTSAVVSVLGASWVVVPIILDHDWVMMYDQPRILDAAMPTLGYFQALFLWNLSPTEGAAYLGMIPACFAVLGIGFLTRERPRTLEYWTPYAITACLVLSFALRGSHVKHIVVTMFFFAFMAGLGADFLQNKFKRSWVAAALTGILILDLSSTSIMPINRLDKDYLHRAGSYLQDEYPTSRILGTQTWAKATEVVASIGPGASITSYYAVQHATGAHNLAATRAHNYIATVIKMTEEDLRTLGNVSDRTRRLLCLLNITFIVNDNGSSMGFPEEIDSNFLNEPLGRAIRLDECAPIVFSTAASIVNGTSGFDKPMLWNEEFQSSTLQVSGLRDYTISILNDMDYDHRSGTASRLPIRDVGSTPLPIVSESINFVEPPTLVNYRVGFETIDITVDAFANGYLQLAHAWYPTLQTLRNGESVANYASAQYFTVVPVLRGRNEIHLTYDDSALRGIWMYVSSIAVSGVFAFFLYCLLASARLRGRIRQDDGE